MIQLGDMVYVAVSYDPTYAYHIPNLMYTYSDPISHSEPGFHMNHDTTR
jgi:hypothetical protein